MFHPRPLAAADSALHHSTLFERVIFLSIAILMAGSALFLLAKAQAHYLINIPRQDGSLSEGIIGSARFINPLLATTDADRDLSSLIYAGLMKVSPEGTLLPELAESYEVIDNGLAYIFTLRENIFFHDGTPLTVDDVIFTIEKAKDAAIKSPKWVNWNDVSVEKIDNRKVKFTPKGTYAPFLQNTTLGILPKTHWKNVTAEQFAFSSLNIKPIGAGPYQINTIIENKSGIPTTFILKPFKSYVWGSPYIKTLTIKLFSNEQTLIEAFNSGIIESMHSITPKKAISIQTEKVVISHTPLLRIFGVYFNTNRSSALSALEVRKALLLAVDKDAIINTVLHGFATATNRPVPPGLLPEKNDIAPATSTEARLNAARNLLEKNKWTRSTTTLMFEKRTKTETIPLSFSIALPNAPELKAIADMLVAQWKELGADVNISVFEPSDLHQSIIRPRKYDALLFGQIIGRDLDLYPFWHSSQRNDPGYNIALYTNLQTDKLLEEARRLTNETLRINKYLTFEKELEKDIPAIFLYAPDFIYVLPARIHEARIGAIAVPAERFSNIHNWYIETDRVWSPLAHIFNR